MRWQFGWPALALAILLFGVGLFLGSYRYSGEPTHSTASERLQPPPADPATSTGGTTVYVPVYSSVYLGVSNSARTVQLAATVSVRNTSSLHPITLQWVRYYDSRENTFGTIWRSRPRFRRWAQLSSSFSVPIGPVGPAPIF